MVVKEKVEKGLPATPGVIAWARARAGFSQHDAVKYFKRIAAWEAGEAMPTYAQLVAMADKFKVPIAVFFFPDPPEEIPTRKSFRTLTDHDFEQIPRPVRMLLRRGRAMQINLAELNDGKNPAPRLITKDLKFSPDVAVRDMATAVRKYLGVPLEHQTSWGTADDALEQWRDALSRVGVFVFKDAFHIDGYFGFCLYGDEFPIVYVNNSSSKTRQIFTLFHELAHLLFHTSGIDVQDDGYIDHLAGDSKKIEMICNEFAGRFLVPDVAFNDAIKGVKATRENAARLADYFKVSREVIYRKMLDRGLIQSDEYKAAAAAWSQQTVQGKVKGGGNYYLTKFVYLGSRYIDLALTRYHQHRFDEDQLAEYLGIKPRNISTFEALYGGRGA